MEIYTDGGCIENPGGIGAWAFVAIANGQVIHKASGAELETSNNRMELTAIIEACKWWNKNASEPLLALKTDSLMTRKCGLGQWKRKANLDLWRKFDMTGCGKFPIEWIKGHSGNVHHDIADRMCTDAMRKLRDWRDTRDEIRSMA